MDTLQEFADTSADPAVRGFLHQSAPGGPDRPIDCLVLTHGRRSELQCSAADRARRSFQRIRPRRPPLRSPFPPVAAARTAAPRKRGARPAGTPSRRRVDAPPFSRRVYLGGHSYGGRQASMLAAAEPGLVERLLLLSYPLHPPQRPTELRTAHFPNLQTPALFVLGARDAFASVQEMTEALKLIPAQTELITVESSGHELMTKRTRDKLLTRVVQAFQSFRKSDPAWTESMQIQQP